MTEYEYKTVELPALRRHDCKDDIQSVLDEHATDGWQLSETVEIQGLTGALIFERPASNDM